VRSSASALPDGAEAVQEVLITFIRILGNILFFAILIRALMSWVMPQEGGGFSRVLRDITEPILAPIRRIMPPLGGIDLSPLLAIILIQLIVYLVASG
jgi:YggT family protein